MAAEAAGTGGCAAAGASWSRLHSQAMLLGRESNEFLIASRCRQLSLSGRAGDVLPGLLSVHTHSAAPRWG